MYEFKQVITDLQKIIAAITDPDTPGTPLIFSTVQTGSQKRISMHKGPKALLGLDGVRRVDSNLDYDVAYIDTKILIIIPGVTEDDNEKLYHYTDLVMDTLKAIRDNGHVSWTTRGCRLDLTNNSLIEFRQFNTGTQKQPVLSTGALITFTIRMNER